MPFLGQVPPGCQVMPDGSVYCESQTEFGPLSSITEAGVMPPGGGGALPPWFPGPGLPAGGGGMPAGGFAMPIGDFGAWGTEPVDGGFPGFFAPEIPPDTMLAPFPWQEPGMLPPDMLAPGGAPEPEAELPEGAPVAGRLAAVGGFGAAVLAALALGGTLG